jgi:hypothetical protein
MARGAAGDAVTLTFGQQQLELCPHRWNPTTCHYCNNHQNYVAGCGLCEGWREAEEKAQACPHGKGKSTCPICNRRCAHGVAMAQYEQRAPKCADCIEEQKAEEADHKARREAFEKAEQERKARREAQREADEKADEQARKEYAERERERLRAAMSLRQAIANVPAAQPQLIDGVLPAGSFVELYAQSGGRKTITVIGWGNAVATGKPWLGRPTRQAPVLGIFLEGARSDHTRWIQQLVAGIGASADDIEGKFDLWEEGKPFKADDPDDIYELSERIEVFAYELVLIDNLSHIHSGAHGAENDPRAMYPVLHPLEQLVRSVPGLTIVVLHHANAAGDSRGGDGIKQHFDRTLSLHASSDRNDAVITLDDVGKHRDGIEIDELRWRYVGGPTDPAIAMAPVGARKTTPAETPEDPDHVRMLGLLPASAESLYAGMGRSRRDVKRVRDALEAENEIVCVDGEWRRVEK